MVPKLPGLDTIDFDFSTYEKKLQQITSVQLDNITDLHSSISHSVEESFLELAHDYFLKIEQLLNQTSEEV